MRALKLRKRLRERETGGRRERENSNYSKILKILKDSSRETDIQRGRDRVTEIEERQTDI